MKPYYERDGITIYHGDCREIMPGLEGVDLVLTDPPYGIGEAAGKNKSRNNLAPAKDYGHALWDDRTIDFLPLVVSMAPYAIVFGGNFYDLPPASKWLVWDKDNSGDFADAELAWTNCPGAVRLLRWRWNGMLKQAPEERYHPCQKPVAVIKWAIDCAPKAETILDPFMGSGTTLVAARDMGRKAIGIDFEERYCEIAAKRLAQGVLFTSPPPPKPKDRRGGGFPTGFTRPLETLAQTPSVPRDGTPNRREEGELQG